MGCICFVPTNRKQQTKYFQQPPQQIHKFTENTPHQIYKQKIKKQENYQPISNNVLEFEQKLKECNYKIAKIKEQHVSDALSMQLKQLEEEKIQLEKQLTKFSFKTVKCARKRCNNIVLNDVWKGRNDDKYCSERCYYKVMNTNEFNLQFKAEWGPIKNNQFKEQFKPAKCANAACNNVVYNDVWKGRFGKVYCSQQCSYQVVANRRF